MRKWVDSEELEAPLKFHAKTTHRTMRVAGHWRGCRFRVAPTAFAKGGSIGGAAALVSHIHRAFAMGKSNGSRLMNLPGKDGHSAQWPSTHSVVAEDPVF